MGVTFQEKEGKKGLPQACKRAATITKDRAETIPD
jgi:hypothetical protein